MSFHACFLLNGRNEDLFIYFFFLSRGTLSLEQRHSGVSILLEKEREKIRLRACNFLYFGNFNFFKFNTSRKEGRSIVKMEDSINRDVFLVRYDDYRLSTRRQLNAIIVVELTKAIIGPPPLIASFVEPVAISVMAFSHR